MRFDWSKRPCSAVTTGGGKRYNRTRLEPERVSKAKVEVTLCPLMNSFRGVKSGLADEGKAGAFSDDAEGEVGCL